YDAEHPKPQSEMDADRVRAHLTELRLRRGRSAVMPFPVVDGYLADAKRRIEKSRDPRRALEDALQSAADDGERDIRYWSLVTRDLHAVQFPATLVDTPDLHAGIVVMHVWPGDGTAGDEFIVLIAMSVDYLKQSGPAGREEEE